MLFFDFEKVKDTIENLRNCKVNFDEYFHEINSSIEKIEKNLADSAINTLLVCQKEEIEGFLISLQQMISTVEFASERYSETRKKLILDSERLFMNSDVSEKMQLISLEGYRKEMKDIYFGKRDMRE